jgi:hypothetical protein
LTKNKKAGHCPVFLLQGEAMKEVTIGQLQAYLKEHC